MRMMVGSDMKEVEHCSQIAMAADPSRLWGVDNDAKFLRAIVDRLKHQPSFIAEMGFPAEGRGKLDFAIAPPEALDDSIVIPKRFNLIHRGPFGEGPAAEEARAEVRAQFDEMRDREERVSINDALWQAGAAYLEKARERSFGAYVFAGGSAIRHPETTASADVAPNFRGDFRRDAILGPAERDACVTFFWRGDRNVLDVSVRSGEGALAAHKGGIGYDARFFVNQSGVLDREILAATTPEDYEAGRHVENAVRFRQPEWQERHDEWIEGRKAELLALSRDNAGKFLGIWVTKQELRDSVEFADLQEWTPAGAMKSKAQAIAVMRDAVSQEIYNKTEPTGEFAQGRDGVEYLLRTFGNGPARRLNFSAEALFRPQASLTAYGRPQAMGFEIAEAMILASNDMARARSAEKQASPVRETGAFR